MLMFLPFLFLTSGQAPTAPAKAADAGGVPAMPAPFTAADFRRHVTYLADDELEGRAIASEGAAKAMQYLIRHFQQGGLKPGSEGGWYQDFSYGKRAKVTARNVIAIFPGKGDLAAEAIIVSTHHDHLGIDERLVKAGKDGIFNGADDNASGCAALLLLVQALHAERPRLPSSHRTVLFISFDAEEHGLVGSRHYVSQPLWQLNKTTANINFDQVGRLFRQKVLAFDSHTSPFLMERITALADQCGLRVETRLHGTGRADSASFVAQSIPAVHFSSGLHADYHQVTDEASKIDHEGGARIAWLSYRLLREMMDNPQRLRFRQPAPEFDVQTILRLAFRMGLVPETSSQSGKYPVIHLVLPNSIAAKHGFKSGDEMISINGQKLENIIDAAVEFAKLRLDRDVRLKVLRAGKTVDLTFPAEAFKDFAGPAVRSLGNDRFEVTFRFKPARKIEGVTLAATFNDWNPKALPLEGPDKDGSYTVTQVMRRGQYEYKFVVGGTEWLADPSNLRTTKINGNSVLSLGDD